MRKGFIYGVLATVVVGLIVGFIGITQGLLIPANADATPSRLERWAASRSLDATVAREAPTQPNPIAATDANYLAGIKLYNENCSACHGAPGARPSTIAIGLYQHAPQLAKHGVEDDPEGETFWKIKHGIRMTGMPAFTRSLSDEQKGSTVRSIPVCIGVRSTLWSNIGTVSATETISASLTSPSPREYPGSTW